MIAETIARALVRARSGGVCEVCGSARATNWHHRKNASQGGAWSASNGLHLCGSGTTGCHGLITCQPWAVDARGQGFTVHPGQDPADVPVYLRPHGWVLLLHDGQVQSAPAPTASTTGDRP